MTTTTAPNRVPDRARPAVEDTPVVVQTSAGEFSLTAEEEKQLERLLRGAAGMREGQQFYTSVAARHPDFPVEWEAPILRATIRALPDRDDLIQRLAVVEDLIAVQRHLPTVTPRLTFEDAWARFARGDLVAGDAATRAQNLEQVLDDASTLLASRVFDEQPLARRTEIMLGIHNTLLSMPSNELLVVADLGLRRFRKMLNDPALTEAQACAMFDAIHSLYFSGTSDLRNQHRFDTIVPIFEAWLEARHGRHAPPHFETNPDRPLTIAYLLHTAHEERGNAVTPLICSLAKAHAAQPNRRVLLYAVQFVDPALVDKLTAAGLTVRTFPQDQRYDRIDEIAASLRADNVDIVATEQNRGIAAALFVRRVAPRQIWLDTGFPFWSLKALDWALSPTDIVEAPCPVTPIVYRQAADTLRGTVDATEVARVRKGFPKDAFVLGVFVRLIKLDDHYLDVLERMLAAHPRFHLVIAGPGDPRAVEAFARREGLAGRVTVIAGMVDLNVYGPAIDLMCDTFPFIGGNACREVSAHGTPVLAKLGTDWDHLLKADRNPDLLAESENEFIALAVRMADDETFHAHQREVALKMAAEYADPAKMIADVEAAIASAISHHNR
jgi:hypothetical protein